MCPDRFIGPVPESGGRNSSIQSSPSHAFDDPLSATSLMRSAAACDGEAADVVSTEATKRVRNAAAVTGSIFEERWCIIFRLLPCYGTIRDGREPSRGTSWKAEGAGFAAAVPVMQGSQSDDVFVSRLGPGDTAVPVHSSSAPSVDSLNNACYSRS